MELSYNKKNHKLNKLQDAILSKKNIEVAGLKGSKLSLVVSLLNNDLKNDLVIITKNSFRANELYEDFLRLLPEEQVLYFPVKDIMPHENIKVPAWQVANRLKVLNSSDSLNSQVIIMPVKAIFEALTPYWRWKEFVFEIDVGEVFKLEELTSLLIESGYQRKDKVEFNGEFSLRGGILDIFPPGEKSPFRVEFFGDEVDSIRKFSIETQKSKMKVNSFTVYPAVETILPDDFEGRSNSILANFDKKITKLNKKGFSGVSKNLRRKKDLFLEAKDNKKLKELKEYLPFFYNNLSTVFDYIEKDSTIILEDINQLEKIMTNYYNEISEEIKDLLEEGAILDYYFENFLNPNDLNRMIWSYHHINLKEDYGPSDKIDLEFSFEGIESFQSRFSLLKKRIEKLLEEDYKIIFTLSDIKKKDKILDILSFESAINKGEIDISKSGISILIGDLSSGFKSKDLNLVLFTESEIFGQKKRKKLKLEDIHPGEKISSFMDLNKGDYVVHENHGIGKFLGIKTLEVQNSKQDYLLLKYAKNDKLYVPPEKIDLVQKYIGGENTNPRLYRLGGSEWQKTKEKVKASVKELAVDLIDLYAKREAITGYAYSEDTVWQKEFEDRFPYEETSDQKRAIQEVKKDMESPHPMDRLLCGDVGYGKTEVAIRAAFKAAIDGKQTAVLVPTTILAQQHFNTFKERIADFPITVSMISRFRSRAEQKVIKEKLKNGKVDIIIGTHRLLSKDINFKDLGLLVIDEEQRFGVNHKEKLKEIKEKVDVLAMTATPIPRTLHMSLSGVRDMSLIETPPENRYPVKTYVKEYSKNLIRDAVRREIKREGQVYFVHNRIKNIEKYANIIKEEVPEAKVAIAHGQMSENKLEKLMYDFYEYKYDVLVCTTIIENGLDISNVNSIIINQAENFGLAQLYQIRGRVGRSNKVAYAYMLYKKDRVLSELANKRLQAIKEFSSLGSGFKIAMRDMEIRGTGNLLGAEQHGHIASIGYSLYCKLLDKAVQELKGSIEKEVIEPEIKLDINAFIPDDYINSSNQKIEFYHRIKKAKSEKEHSEILDELIDRFGDIPEPLLNLVYINNLKSSAAKLSIIKIIEKNNSINFVFKDKNSINTDAILKLINDYPRKININSRENPIIKLKKTDESKQYEYKMIKKLINFLNELANYQSQLTI
ncbi:MAG: transcription-repair coupling factor [Bacillota bacterium]